MQASEQSMATRGRRAARVLIALWLGSLAGLAPIASARESALPRLTLEVPRELHVGEHAHVDLVVELPAEAAEPLLVTPFREGEALDVVKGRLLRSDARDPSATPLRFELPVLAAAPGTALIGVKLLAYVCAPRCRAVEVEARASVLVLPR